MTKPTVLVTPPVRRSRASAFGRNRRAAAACCTLMRVAGSTLSAPDSARDTVLVLTSASRATSASVARPVARRPPPLPLSIDVMVGPYPSLGYCPVPVHTDREALSVVTNLLPRWLDIVGHAELAQGESQLPTEQERRYMDDAALLEMRSITKEFPGVLALSEVSLTVGRPEIHCDLRRERCGQVDADEGAVRGLPVRLLRRRHLLRGRVVQVPRHHRVRAAGIVIIHQELALIPELSIAENIFLGNERRSGEGPRSTGTWPTGAASS